jgi:hypothetical protein
MATKKRKPSKAKKLAPPLRVLPPTVSVPPVPPKRSWFASIWAQLTGKP